MLVLRIYSEYPLPLMSVHYTGTVKSGEAPREMQEPRIVDTGSNVLIGFCEGTDIKV
jgi:hypothetical protein